MKRASKKILSLALAMALVLGMFTLAPVTAYAAAPINITGGSQTISTPGLYNIATVDSGATITVATNSVALTGTHANLSVVISVGITLTLKDAHISRTGDGNPIQAGGADCVLILAGDNSVTGGSGFYNTAGVNVPDTASLTIEGPGKLTARGGQYSAGIGGNYLQSSGGITIRHATVAAYGGGNGGAGIGGGYRRDGANITIVNSSIDAHGGNGSGMAIGGGAGIGGGGSSADDPTAGNGTNITITGSAVVAAGGNGGDGGGAAGSSGGGAGIGGGGGGGSNGSNGCSGGSGTNITIDAVSTVQAIGGGGGSASNGGGGGGGAAIGGGGGAGGNNNYNGSPGGAGTGNTISITLAVGSKGGTGNTPSGTGSKGGDGALGGGGGGGGNTATKGGAIGTPGTELGSVTVGSTTVDLSSRPDRNYTGYPALPAVTGPSNQTVTAGGNASFTVSPSGGTDPYFYQWQINSGAWTDITNGGVYSGATTATLTLTNVPLADNGKQYRCVVNDSVWREAASVTATLTVNAADTTAPTVSVSPTGTGVAQSTASLVLTFSEKIDITTAGTVSMSPNAITGGAIAANDSRWNAVCTVLTIPISGLAYNTPYTIDISGFQDVAGNTMTTITGHTFTTESQPDTTAPTIVSVVPANGATGVEIGGNVVVTFSESMDTAVGSLSLDNGGGTLSGTWSTSAYVNDTFTASYSGLAWATLYTVTIEDFTDVAGIATNPDPDTSHSFTTKDQPTGPDVSPTTLNLDLNGNSTGTLTIFLGQSGNQAATAAVTVDPANAGDISVNTASLNGDGTVIVTGHRVVSGAGITVEFSGLDYATSIDIFVTVNVTDSTSITHTVTFDLAGGIHTGGGMLTQTVPDGGAATAPTITRSGYTFNGWDKSFSNVTADMTVTAQWTRNSSSSSSDSDSSYTPPVVWPVEVTVRPDFPTTAQLTLSQAPDKHNALAFTITKDMVQQALDKAKEEAKKQGCESYGYALEFYFRTTTTINSLNITFNTDALALLEAEGIKETSVITNTFRFGFDLAAIKELNRQSSGKAVTVSASRFSKLSDAAKKLIGSRPAWDVNISYKNSGKTYNITNLGKGTITMGMRYTPASGENTGNIIGVYVPGSGKPQTLTSSSYDNGWLNLIRGSLSVYGVGYITDAPAFTDTTNHWAKDNIDFVASCGLISGTSATAFSPDTAITRADFLMALGKLSGADVSGYTTSSFTDVPATSAAMSYIEWAVKNGIVQGIGNNQFDPGNKITREDMAVMMQNYSNATGYTLLVSQQAVTFADDAKISAYAKDAVKAIQQTGVISGKPNNLFDPQGSTTRAEAATILRRFVELVIDEGTARGWVQNDAGQWQYINTYGKAVTGWLTVGDSKYWFDDKGVMVSGKWLQIGGKWYYFDSDGKLATNTTIDGYGVGADGAR